MKATRKLLSISLEFGSVNEVKDALNKIMLQLHNSPLRYDRMKIDTAICEWSITNESEPDYREEFINGNWCQVYQSKMNQDGKV